MGFDNKDNFRRSRSEGSRDGGDRERGRDRGGRTGGFGGQGGNTGRIDNFEKPLLELLKEINEKLDLLLKK